MAETWLDEREARAWRAFTRLHADLVGRLGRQLQRDTGLSTADYEVLVNLSEAPEHRLRSFQLGRALQWEKSRVSHQLTRMETRGLVAREGCSTDRRGAEIVLTPTGLAAIEAAAPDHVAAVRRWFVEALSDEQLDQFADAAEAIVARLAEDGDDPCDPQTVMPK